jgi:hypothetical protein
VQVVRQAGYAGSGMVGEFMMPACHGECCTMRTVWDCVDTVDWPHPARVADYILAVHDPAAWHRENIERNGAAHYSILRMLGAQAIARIQVRPSSRLAAGSLWTWTR